MKETNKEKYKEKAKARRINKQYTHCEETENFGKENNKPQKK
jgi:hypothetical protein